MYKIFWSGLLLLITQTLCADTTQPRIIGGNVADSGEWPSMVYLALREQGSDFETICGGNLVGSRWVLTAAHCVIEGNGRILSPDEVFAWVGNNRAPTANDVSSDNYISAVSVTIHPDYSPVTQDSDLALIELPFDINLPVMPIYSNPLAACELATVTGWGATFYDELTGETSSATSLLREVTLPIVPNDTCARKLSGISTITDNMLCAGFDEGGRDSCSGDSGGPLMVFKEDEWQQAGIVSFGAGCALPDAPGVYTRLGRFAVWIHNVTNGEVSPPDPDPNAVIDNSADTSCPFSDDEGDSGSLGLFWLAALLLWGGARYKYRQSS